MEATVRQEPEHTSPPATIYQPLSSSSSMPLNDHDLATLPSNQGNNLAELPSNQDNPLAGLPSNQGNNLAGLPGNLPSNDVESEARPPSPDAVMIMGVEQWTPQLGCAVLQNLKYEESGPAPAATHPPAQDDPSPRPSNDPSPGPFQDPSPAPARPASPQPGPSRPRSPGPGPSRGPPAGARPQPSYSPISSVGSCQDQDDQDVIVTGVERVPPLQWYLSHLPDLHNLELQAPARPTPQPPAPPLQPLGAVAPSPLQALITSAGGSLAVAEHRYFPCTTCNITFPNEQMMITHITMHSHDGTFTCWAQGCWYAAGSALALMTHWHQSHH